LWLILKVYLKQKEGMNERPIPSYKPNHLNREQDMILELFFKGLIMFIPF